jgi:carboxylesterase
MMNFGAFAGAEHAAYTLEGDGRGAAVLLHGFPGTPAEMRPLAQFLNDHGWTANAPLLPGFGADIETLPKRSYREWIATARTAVQTLRREHERVVLIGFSMGGAVALNAALEQPPNALVLINPLARIDNVLWRMLPVLKRVFPQVRPFRLIKLDFNNPETRKSITQFMPGTDLDDPTVRAQIREFAVPVAMFDQLRQVGEAAYKHAPQLTIPTLVIQAQSDTTVSPTMTRQMAARLRQGARFVEISGEHHVIKPEQEGWAQTTRLVLDFVETERDNAISKQGA